MSGAGGPFDGSVPFDADGEVVSPESDGVGVSVGVQLDVSTMQKAVSKRSARRNMDILRTDFSAPVIRRGKELSELVSFICLVTVMSDFFHTILFSNLSINPV